MWKEINDFLNSYGGLISSISLLISIVIVVLTGNIKKSIKNSMQHDNYLKQRTQVKKALQGISDSINKDNIYDVNLMHEISVQIGILQRYDLFLDKKTIKNLKEIDSILDKDFDINNKSKINILLGKIIGALQAKEVNVI